MTILSLFTLVSTDTHRKWIQHHLMEDRNRVIKSGSFRLTYFMTDISSGITCVCNVTAAGITVLSPSCPPISGPAAACVRLLCAPQVSVAPCRRVTASVSLCSLRVHTPLSNMYMNTLKCI